MEMEKVRVYIIPILKHNCILNLLDDQMETERNTILFTLIYQDNPYPVQTRRDQYHTLMTLISDHLSLLDFGLCCGMGSCGTCMVRIKEKYSPIERSALACEVQVNDDLANTQITIDNNNHY